MSIMNNMLQASINFHYVLHGFIDGRGAGTKTMGGNLTKQLAELCHEPLFQVFLDVSKSYDYLDKRICMDILIEYGLRPTLQRLLQ